MPSDPEVTALLLFIKEVRSYGLSVRQIVFWWCLIQKEECGSGTMPILRSGFAPGALRCEEKLHDFA